jgi:periplasmic copper chaperone A
VLRSSQSLHYGPACEAWSRPGSGQAPHLAQEPVRYDLTMRVAHTIPARVVACCVCALTAALVLVGCSAGQITQTDHQLSAVDGASGAVGNTIALRNVFIPFPPNQNGTYPAGSTVPVILTIVNQGDIPDQLITVSSPAASQAAVLGTTQIGPGTTVTSTTAGGVPTSPLVVGELRVALTTTEPLRAGLNTPLTFQFRNAGSVTLLTPMAPPPAEAS